MLNEEYNYFIKKKPLLLKKYKGKFVVVVDHKIDGSYLTLEEAYKEASKKYKLGSFLIQKCINDIPSRQSFHSRVVF
jgi:hypothetical protein